MIKHIVMWRLRDDLDKPAAARRLKEKLEGLRGRIPGMHTIEVGIDFSKSADSADVVLYSEFESREALAHYQSHPEHEAVKPYVLEVRSERRVVDYETARQG